MGVLVLIRFRVPDEDSAAFRDRAHEALDLLAARPGYVRARLARAYDEPELWCLVSEWESVGAYRRALSAELRMRLMPLFAGALDEPSAFEVLAEAEPGGSVNVTATDVGSLRSRP